MGIDWGDAPTWAGAAFAAAAAYGALMTMRSQRAQIREQRDFIADQRKVLNLQEQELTDGARARQLEQARQVSLDADIVRVVDTVGSARRQVDIGWRWVTCVKNASNAPIYGVRVQVGDDLHEAAWPAVSRQRPDGPEQSGAADVIKAGALWCFRSPVYESEFGGGTVRPVALFRDESHREWHLDEHGSLSHRGS
ncbi:hypothetical protein [Streptomyces sp. YPW6]|uniref:hypothetical protein n=1 Tax=Streptomyces sp. YPW6 TaxID=2840373 RepID=UPI003D74E69B